MKSIAPADESYNCTQCFPILSTRMKIWIETVQIIIVATTILYDIAADEKDWKPSVEIQILDDEEIAIKYT